MKTAISLLLWLMIPTMLIGAPVVAIVLGAERQALVAQNDRISSEELGRSASLLMRYNTAQMTMGETITIVARENELNAALTAGLADRRTIRGRVAVEGSRIHIEATAELPDAAGLFGRYINFAVHIGPSRRGLDIMDFRIGKIDFPKPVAPAAIQVLPEALLGPGNGARIIDNIRSVDISGKTVAIGFRPMGKWSARLARSKVQQESKTIDMKLQSRSGEHKLGYNQNEIDTEGNRN